MRRTLLVSIAVASVGGIVGCAPNRAQQPRSGEPRESSAELVVTATELTKVGAGRSVFAALQHARPSFLVTRGGEPVVSIDGSAPTDVSILRNVAVSDVHEVRLVRGTSGASRVAVLANGDVASGRDVIMVITRRGR